MFQQISDEVRNCYAHADVCAREARIAVSADTRDHYLCLEQGWLVLARSYEFAGRLALFTSESGGSPELYGGR